MQETEPQPRKAEIKHYSLTELADLFRMDRRTMGKLINTRLSHIKKPAGRFYTQKDVEEIFTELGHPNERPVEEKASKIKAQSKKKKQQPE